MKKDIPFPVVEDVLVIVAKSTDGWIVFLLNRNKNVLENVLITSRGYGEDQKTSTLRHMIPKLEAGEYALIESINPSVFHLNNEYWVSFYIGQQIYDKKYIFLPDSILEKHLIPIPELDMKGIVHP